MSNILFIIIIKLTVKTAIFESNPFGQNPTIDQSINYCKCE